MLLQTANVSVSKTKKYIPIRKMSFLKSVPSTCKRQLLFTSNLFTLKKRLASAYPGKQNWQNLLLVIIFGLYNFLLYNTKNDI